MVEALKQLIHARLEMWRAAHLERARLKMVEAQLLGVRRALERITQTRNNEAR